MKKLTCKLNVSYVIALLLPLTVSCSNNINKMSIIPASSCQMIMVLTDSPQASNGILYYFQLDCNKPQWRLANGPIPVLIGKNGLGWSTGLHDIANTLNYPVKREGDGRSPAGVFHLNSVFGYKPADQMTKLKMPYLHLTQMTECIDDPDSRYYNQIVYRNKITETDHVDWKSSEKMSRMGHCYELGVVVDYNHDPIKHWAGSCIFLHNWKNQHNTTAGCTAMAPEVMKEIVNWLDDTKDPVFVLLTKQLYCDLMNKCNLPKTDFMD